MKKSEYIKKSFFSALGVFAYIFLVVLVIFNGEKLFGEPEGIIIPVSMLLLFVVSAAITGLLVLGKPGHLYLTGFKREGIILLLCTLGWLILFLLAVVAKLLLIKM